MSSDILLNDINEKSNICSVINENGIETKNYTDSEHDIENENSCKIFVGNIPYQCTQEEFEKCFKDIDGFVKAELIKIHGTNVSRGFGFVTMKTITSANILKNRNNITLRGRILRFTSYQTYDSAQFSNNLDTSRICENSVTISVNSTNNNVNYNVNSDDTQKSLHNITHVDTFDIAHVSSHKCNTKLRKYYNNSSDITNSREYQGGLNNYVFIDGIPDGKNRKWLKNFFSDYEPLGKCFVSMNCSTGEIKNNGVIEIIDDTKYRLILSKKIHVVDGVSLETSKYKSKVYADMSINNMDIINSNGTYSKQNISGVPKNYNVFYKNKRAYHH
jgi:hypothetical protein